EIVAAAPQPFLGPLVPEVAALHVSLIGLGIIRVVSGQFFLLLSGELHEHCVGHSIGDHVLHGEDIRESLVKRSLPERKAVTDPNKLHSYSNLVSAPLDLAVENRLNLELTSGQQKVLVERVIFED